MKKLCLITVWMGKLPDTYEMWLMSAKKNPTVDFFLISDSVETKVEENIHFVHEEIGELKARFQTLFSFPIKLKSAYKILPCSYLPAMWQVKLSARLHPMKNWRCLRKNFATRKINFYVIKVAHPGWVLSEQDCIQRKVGLSR